jgi:hypothetical protein
MTVEASRGLSSSPTNDTIFFLKVVLRELANTNGLRA